MKKALLAVVQDISNGLFFVSIFALCFSGFLPELVVNIAIAVFSFNLFLILIVLALFLYAVVVDRMDDRIKRGYLK